MKKNKRLFILLTLYFSIGQIDAQIPLSFEESLHLLNQGNQSLKIADKSIEIAKAERDKLNAFWYPSLQSTGAFVHMSEKIEVKQPLSHFLVCAIPEMESKLPNRNKQAVFLFILYFVFQVSSFYFLFLIFSRKSRISGNISSADSTSLHIVSTGHPPVWLRFQIKGTFSVKPTFISDF